MIEHETLVVGGTEVVHLGLDPVRLGSVSVLGALANGSESVRIFMNPAAHADKVTEVAGAVPTQVTSIRGNAGLYVDGPLPAPVMQNVTVTYDGRVLSLPILSSRAELMAEQDCLLTTLNQTLSVPAHSDDKALNPTADPAYIRNWLAHHVQVQGVTAAVFINRLGPDEFGADFAQRLAEVLAEEPLGMSRVIVLDVPGPTGKAGQGDERHLHYAPNAPGKKRMEPPTLDPWRAVFGDEVLLEFVRHWFFPTAAGVAYFDLSDWLAPPTSGTTVFEDARQASPDPLIGLSGLSVFPWKLPNDGSAKPGDHICRPFDLRAGFSRWVFSPAKGRDLPNVWRPHRIIGLSSQAAPDQKLWRMTALRHPGAAPAQLVPKSSLRESPELLSLSQDTFGHKPFRVPKPEIKQEALSVPASDRGEKIVLVTAMKNEGPFLLEWIAYHRAIGVSDIIVFTNDCTDGTDTFLDLLAARGIVEHYENPFREMGLKPQHAGFRAAEKMKTVKNADWLMTADVDEFINVHVGDGHLRDLFAAVGDANMISCTWRLFGNADLDSYEDDFLLRQFDRCAVKNASRPHQAWGFKTLYQNNGIFKKLGVHRPKGLHGAAAEHLNWVNGSGKRMPAKEYRSGWRSNAQTIGYDLVSLNHYAVRSTESFLVKRDRGRVNHVDRDQGEAYWFRMNHNTTQDQSIQRMIPALQKEWDQLIADPQIATAHSECVAAHRTKIAELRSQTEPAAFYKTLNSDRFRALSRLLSSNVFLTGPGAVPQGLIDKFTQNALPKDFYFTVERPEDTQH